MYELKFEDKVKVWKDLRDELESSAQPFELLSKFVKDLPRSSRKTNAWDPNSVAEPWHLIENSSFTEYEIALLYAYTLQLTDRFSKAKVEIHISKDINKDVNMYLVYLDGSIVLGYNNEVFTSNLIPEGIVSQKVIQLPPLH
jgi:hypothetical protein|tara:strand:- start:249 stop:674 length:426 start_codon:yes stop_codon:yes gene_type:complete